MVYLAKRLESGDTMMKTSRLSATLVTSFGMLLAVSAASPDCWAQFGFVFFDGGPTGLDTAFVDAANWDPDGVPDANPACAGGDVSMCRILGIQDGLSSTFSGGSTRVFALRVGSPNKESQLPTQDTRFGRLTMTGGSLEVIGGAAQGWFIVGRERENAIFGGDYNKNSIVDAADYTVWQDTLGSTLDLRADGDENGTIEQADYDFWKARFGNVVKGGEIIMTGTSTITANGLIVGERSPGLLSVGPDALVDLRDWITDDPNDLHFGGTQDFRIGVFGPAHIANVFGEPGLDGIGLVDIQGTLNAKDLLISPHGATGEIRLSGGTVNLNGELIMDLCENCLTDPDLLARRSAKVSIIGSSGTFNVGLDPDPNTVDPNSPGRDLLANSPMAHFSFTADAGGVVPITVVDNGVEASGIANIDTATLELNLDAYTSASPLTLINAAPGNLSGVFGTVTFLGNTTATVNYDVSNGDVFLDNFLNALGTGTGSLAGSAVPEPSGLMMMVTLGLCLFSLGAGANRQRARLWVFSFWKIKRNSDQPPSSP
ncbi:MAG: hypothetical protein IH831_08195, partial [Planctomycetes bacterium]|nr:hypothetical protein [Planctomycetota bacterium]